MRHCNHFTEYAAKLRQLGCQKLITNARWHLAVETIALQAPGVKFSELQIGWYACRCGATGFKSGAVELITPETDEIIYEIIDCPKCSANQI
jgi:rubredoxin